MSQHEEEPYAKREHLWSGVALGFFLFGPLVQARSIICLIEKYQQQDKCKGTWKRYHDVITFVHFIGGNILGNQEKMVGKKSKTV